MPATQRSAGQNSKVTRAQVARLCRTLAGLENPDDMIAFLTDLLTPVERAAFAKRWHTVWLLAQGLKFAEIQRRLGVAMATITHANRVLCGERDGKGFRIALALEERSRRRSVAPQTSTRRRRR
jgi:uncharacterized protein YerC